MSTIQNSEDFKQFVAQIQSRSYYKQPLAFGICRVDLGQANQDKVLQATYPVINWNENFGSAAIFMDALEASGVKIESSGSEFVAPVSFAFLEHTMQGFAPYLDEAHGDAHKNVQLIAMLHDIATQEGMRPTDFRVVFLFDNTAPQSVEAVYLKLYALSAQKAALRTVNLDGAFGKLANVAWSGNTPIELEWLRANEIEMKLSGTYPVIDFVDKFPRFLQHIIPADNTRILDSSKVRFGAQLHAGTTVMPGASYINFNAGTTGPVMVEGRISSSAIVGAGSDVGGGASILGVLSGTDGNPISIGQNTLLGANSTCGVPLGDGCILDAGLTLLAGTKIYIDPSECEKIKNANPGNTLATKTIFKGSELASLNGMHFRQDSQSGQMIARRSTREVKLNADLH